MIHVDSGNKNGYVSRLQREDLTIRQKGDPQAAKYENLALEPVSKRLTKY